MNIHIIVHNLLYIIYTIVYNTLYISDIRIAKHILSDSSNDSSSNSSSGSTSSSNTDSVYPIVLADGIGTPDPRKLYITSTLITLYIVIKLNIYSQVVINLNIVTTLM